MLLCGNIRSPSLHIIAELLFHIQRMLKTLMLLTWKPNWCHQAFYLAPSRRQHLPHFHSWCFHSWWKDKLQQLLSRQENHSDFHRFIKGSFTYLGCVFPIRKSTLSLCLCFIQQETKKDKLKHIFLSSDEEKKLSREQDEKILSKIYIVIFL